MTLADALVVECVGAGLIALVLWIVEARRGRPRRGPRDPRTIDFFWHG